MAKKKKSISKTKDKKIWYYVRVSFWVMIGLWVIASFSDFGGDLFLFLWVAVTIFNFVTSIIHLTKYKEKAFAITSLVFASYLVLSFFVGLILGAIMVESLYAEGEMVGQAIRTLI